jgi:hypothetical protein
MSKQQELYERSDTLRGAPVGPLSRNPPATKSKSLLPHFSGEKPHFSTFWCAKGVPNVQHSRTYGEAAQYAPTQPIHPLAFFPWRPWRLGVHPSSASSPIPVSHFNPSRKVPECPNSINALGRREQIPRTKHAKAPQTTPHSARAEQTQVPFWHTHRAGAKRTQLTPGAPSSFSRSDSSP